METPFNVDFTSPDYASSGAPDMLFDPAGRHHLFGVWVDGCTGAQQSVSFV